MEQANDVQNSIRAAKDWASTGNLTMAIETILPALEQFLQFAEPEQTATQRAIWSAQLNEPLPQTGAGAEAVLALLRDVVIPHGLRLGVPGFSGWVATAPTTVPTAASFAAVVSGSAYQCLHACNLLEAQALRWLAELLGLAPTSQGLFTSGGSVANLMGLGAARQYAAERLGVDAARDGMALLPKPVSIPQQKSIMW